MEFTNGFGQRFGSLALFAGLTCLSTASAQNKTFHHDQYSENIYEAVNQVNGQLLQNEPGFVLGEAFGAMYRPSGADYPIKILGVDVIFGGPAGFPDLSTSYDIEIYLNAGFGPEPNNTTPDFVIPTTDFWNANTNEFGIPIKGNTAYQFDFDYMEQGGAPPLATEGNIIVMLRNREPAGDFSVEWDNILCSKFSEIGLCGCQPTSMILDGDGLSPQTNIINLVWPLGGCSGNTAWKYFEDIESEGKSLKGDVIVRLRVQSSDVGCQGDCSGKQCGDDGCGNPCGFCDDGALCNGGQCATCDCAGKPCGDDGCGNSCGSCGPGLVCGGNTCSPDPSCTCDGKSCGDNGCGVSCGTCGAGELCAANQCGPNPACDCDGKVCGDDGCGGSCGMCSDGDMCQAGACVPSRGCTPECTDLECGDDGCGGSCGTCDAGTCTSGKCVVDVPAGELTVTKIDPGFGLANLQTQVSILGGGFAGNMSARLGGTSLIAVQVENASLMSATVPTGLAAGTYSLIVSNADGQTALLEDAFEIRTEAATCGDGTCNDGESCSSCPTDCGQCPEQIDTGSGSGAAAGGCSTDPAAPAPVVPTLLLLWFVAIAIHAARRSRSAG